MRGEMKREEKNGGSRWGYVSDPLSRLFSPMFQECLEYEKDSRRVGSIENESVT